MQSTTAHSTNAAQILTRASTPSHLQARLPLLEGNIDTLSHLLSGNAGVLWQYVMHPVVHKSVICQSRQHEALTIHWVVGPL